MPELRAIFKQLTRAEAASRCECIGLPFAPVMRPHDLFHDPQLAQPGAMTDVTLPDGKSTPIPALPIEMNGRRFGRRLDIPRVGEHSKEIARELGMEREEIEDLIVEKILGIEG